MTDSETVSPSGLGMTRRHFLVASAAGLTIGVATIAGCDSAPTRNASPTTKSFGPAPTTNQPIEPPTTSVNSYVHIGTDGNVTIAYGGSEFGQGTMSGLAQVVAEELKVDWDAVTVKQSVADPEVSYFTGGSTAMRFQFSKLAMAGAAAREMLLAAGAQRLGAKPADCHAAGGRVIVTSSGGKRSVGYGEIATLAATLPVPANPPLTDPSKYTLIGTSVARADIAKKVNGSAIYGLDVRIPGMQFAVVKHAPAFGATLVGSPSILNGATAVVQIVASDSRGAVAKDSVYAVAVVASNTWSAMQSAKVLEARWKLPPNVEQFNTDALRADATKLMNAGAAVLAEAPVGDADSQIAIVDGDSIDVTYSLPYVPHACMEVLNCTVDLRDASCEVWAPTQSASAVAALAATMTKLPPEAITVHTTFLGGGLGRKIETDFISAAIQVALKIRKPVMVVYPREEDFANDQYRPSALVRVQARAQGGAIQAWKYRNVSPSIFGQRGFGGGGADSQATDGSTALPYDIAHKTIEWVAQSGTVPVGFWRSVGHSINAFAVECAIDELAAAAKVDPFVFRLGALAANTRARTVVETADQLSVWRKTLADGHGWGMAFAESFGTLVCQVVEVSDVRSDSLRVDRVACVVDCGRAINPNSVEMQMQGAIVHGLTAALWGEMKFEKGAATKRNFDQHRVLRLDEMPEVTVKIVDSGESLGGIGEPGVPPIAPALVNAVFQATGVRHRSLPLFVS